MASGFLIGIWLQGNAIIITDQENKIYISDQLFGLISYYVFHSCITYI